MDCIYLAAGMGQRAQQTLPKQLCLLGGRPLMVHSLDVLQRSDAISTIYVMTPPSFNGASWTDVYKDVFRDYGLSKCTSVVGGSTRQESVYLGLRLVESPRVLIHEAARPFISSRDILRLQDAMDAVSDAATLTIPIPFAVATCRYGRIADALDRSVLRNLQLPQIFSTPRLKQAHALAIAQRREFVDDTTLMVSMLDDAAIEMLAGSDRNFKITTPLDFVLAGAVLNE